MALTTVGTHLVRPHVLSMLLGIMLGHRAFASAFDDAEAATIRDAIRQTRAAIRTVHARFEIDERFEPTADGPRSSSAIPRWVEWWQDGDHVRYRAKLRIANRIDDRLWRDGVRKCLLTHETPPTKPDHNAVIGPSADFFEDIENLWKYALFEYPFLKSHPSIADLIGPPYLIALRSEHIDGRTFRVVDFRVPSLSPSQEGELWLEPARNYAVARLVLRSPQLFDRPANQVTREVTRASEVSRGVFFPTEVQSQIVTGESQRVQFTWRVNRLTVNAPIPESTFVLRFPKGTFVANHFKGTSYRVDSNEAITGEEQPIAAYKREYFDAPARYQTDDPRSKTPSRLGQTIGIIVVGLAAIGLMYRFWRRRGNA